MRRMSEKEEEEALEEAKADFIALGDEEDVQHADVMAAFLGWDTNGDGVIDKDELKAVFTGLGLHVGEKELQAMFEAADLSQDQRVDYSEFLHWIFNSAHWQLRNQFLKVGVSWNGVHKGRNASILEDRLSVKRVRGAGETEEFPPGHAIVVSSGAARAFRFEVLDNNSVYKGGFEVGFASCPPEELPQPLPEQARDLPCAYVSDSCGRLVVFGEEEPGSPPWNHRLLPSGTVVDVRCKDGKFQVLLNGKTAADWHLNVPDELDLYPLVSVYGTTQAVKLLPLDSDA
mmetsp:Transcript_46784/g.109518  ORF Transcript_46784/g.109518 Transcript_46784/m.109518 type:complete len:287 (-) Transcript_46784:32-892(-)